ncbi:DEAD/DEAH box helicase [Ceratobasidium sp. AG-Ba]|nr:DEAD/DEAH box helicase [Ceratobasidium sp. AG-Ba]
MPVLSTLRGHSQSVPEPDDPSDLTPRAHLVSKITEKTGFEPREFQIQATEAVLNGSDTVVHAETGSGKTLIFAAPHFVLENRVSIVISPLILLQRDQQDRMRKMGLKAIALNKEVHVEPETWNELAQGKFEIVLLSPEMALHSEDVCKVFDSETFRKALVAIHIDEAHTVSLWGGDFRKDYRELGRVRARLPKGLPVTLDILLFFDPEETDPTKIPPTIIYIDDVHDVTEAVITLYNWLHPTLRNQEVIMPVHAWMTPNYRSEAMAKFASGKVRVIIATEAAGMPLLLKGCDIPNIKRVIQFGVCGSIGFDRSKMLSCNELDELGVAPTVLAKIGQYRRMNAVTCAIQTQPPELCPTSFLLEKEPRGPLGYLES